MTPRQTPIRFEPELEQTLRTLSANTGLSVNNLVSMAVAQTYSITESKAYNAAQVFASTASTHYEVIDKLAGKKEK